MGEGEDGGRRDAQSFSCVTLTPFCVRREWSVKSFLVRPRVEGDGNGTCYRSGAMGQRMGRSALGGWGGVVVVVVGFGSVLFGGVLW